METDFIPARQIDQYKKVSVNETNFSGMWQPLERRIPQGGNLPIKLLAYPTWSEQVYWDAMELLSMMGKKSPLEQNKLPKR